MRVKLNLNLKLANFTKNKAFEGTRFVLLHNASRGVFLFVPSPSSAFRKTIFVPPVVTVLAFCYELNQSFLTFAAIQPVIIQS